MKNRLLHTPEGMRDIYNEECERKQALEERLHRVMRSYGFGDIETPSLEFFDVFGKEVGTIPSAELYRFFDREGNTLVLRPDFTPSIARAVSKYFADETEPVRLCYAGNTFVNNSSYQGRLKENTQMGAELIGDGSVDADAEMIAMAVQMLVEAGLKDFQISIGNVRFIAGLLDAAGIGGEDAEGLIRLLVNRNAFGAGQFLERLGVKGPARAALEAVPGLVGSEEVLDKAERLAEGTKAAEAVARLREILSILKLYGVDKHVTFDLGMTSRYMYYTGIIFRGYTYGVGEAVIKGGRYDGLLGHFGKPAPAIGFVSVIGLILNALARGGAAEQESAAPDRVLILYGPGDREEAVAKVRQLRESGVFAAMRSLGADEDAAEVADRNRDRYREVIIAGGAKESAQ